MSQTSSDQSYRQPTDRIHVEHAQKQRPRSLPIPREVNNFIIDNFGALYYNSWDVSERSDILKNIESALHSSGYNISCSEIERRLKNMKSHYRRKKADLQQGEAKTVEWEYFSALDKIFSVQEEPKTIKVIQKPLTPKTETAVKRKSETPEDGSDNTPEDLSVKRRRVIEFNDVSDIQEQLPTIPAFEEPLMNTASQSDTPGREETIKKIVESIRAVDQQRLIFDQQRIQLEIRRYETDLLGYQLSSLLSKITNQPQN